LLQSLPKLLPKCRVPGRLPEMLSLLGSGTVDGSFPMGVCGDVLLMLWRNMVAESIRGVVEMNSGAVNVSDPILPLVTGLLKVDRRRLGRPDRRPCESPFFVGVGGISSTLD
jgi:hypothetical protein